MAITNVFVVFTSAHVFHAQNIIDTYSLKDYKIVCTSSALASEFDPEDGVINVGGVYPFDLIRLWQSKRFFKANTQKVNLFVPHFYNVASQALYNFFKVENLLAEVCILPDGNLLFNAFKVTKLTMDNLLRKVKSILLLSDYELLEGDICSISSEQTFVYSYIKNTRYSEVSNFTERSIIMPSVDVKRGSGLLILGHFNQKVLDTDTLCKSISTLLARNDIIYYKPHPRIKLSQDLFYKTLKDLDDNIELIENTTSIEKIINNYQNVDTLFAVGSSSLINIKLMHPDLEVHCCALKEYFGTYFDSKLKDNLNKLNILEIKYDPSNVPSELKAI